MPQYLLRRSEQLTDEVDELDDDVGPYAALEVTWVRSYVSLDRSVSYCLYDGPSPDAILRAARLDGLAAEITEVTVLDPYFSR